MLNVRPRPEVARPNHRHVRQYIIRGAAQTRGMKSGVSVWIGKHALSLRGVPATPFEVSGGATMQSALSAHFCLTAKSILPY